MKWIKTAAEKIPEPEIDPGLTGVELDEMWHFLGKKKETLDMAGSRTN